MKPAISVRMCGSARVGRVPVAIRRCRLVAILLGLLAAPAQALGAGWPAPYEQDGVAVTVADAADGVAARDRAYRDAMRRAWLRLKLALAQPFARATDREIEAMVAAIVVEEERVLPRGYRGRLTIRFDPERVAAIAGLLPPEPDPAEDEPDQGSREEEADMVPADDADALPLLLPSVPASPAPAPGPEDAPFRFRW